MLMLMLMLQGDATATEKDADDHQDLSSVTKNRQNESVSDSNCQEGISDYVAVASAAVMHHEP